MIGLDTHVPGELHGRISAEQLNWLRRQLNERTEPIVLFMHHSPILVNSEWLDEIGLMEPEAFASVVTSTKRVRAIFTGHIHQEFTGRLGEVSVLSAPSTAIQFRPGTAELERDLIPPGFRVVELEPDSIQSRVVRLPELRFPPDPV